MIYNKSLNVLEKQVYELSEAVQAHWTVDRVLADFGIKIMGQLNSPDLLPTTPPGGVEAYGEAYAVGEEENDYKIYIWTRPDAYHPEAYWFNIGSINIAGPQGAPGVSINKAVINANNQLVLTMTDGSTITVPGNLKGDTGPSPKIYLSNVEDGVQIRVENPDGSISYTTVKNGINGQSIVGPSGPPGYFNILGALANEGQLPVASTVDLGTAYLIWHEVSGEENGGHYDLYLNINSNGAQVWQNTGRVSAGTYIFQNGQVVSQFNADTKLDKITTTGAYKFYGVNAGGNVWNPILRQIPQTTNSTYKYQPVMYDITDGAHTNNGLIQIAENPIERYHTASKAYVDNKFKVYQHNQYLRLTNDSDEVNIYYTCYDGGSGAKSYMRTFGMTSNLSGYYNTASGNHLPILYGEIDTTNSNMTVAVYDGQSVYIDHLDSYTIADINDTVNRVI